MVARMLCALLRALLRALLWTMALAGCAGGSAPPTAITDAAPSPQERARAFYDSQPIYLRPVVDTPVPAGLPDLRAATCGVCHTEIYAEWRISTHARAWMDDAQFQAELAKSRKGKDVGWMCVNCHTPVVAQLPRLVTGLVGGDLGRPVYVDNPAHDPTLQLEAITCATCHVRDGVIGGVYGDGEAPHPVRVDPGLRTVDVCTRCHQATATFPDQNLACVFDTGGELAAGPYGAEGYTCQRCHMPEVDRPLVVGGTRVRTTRRHWFGGSLIPKRPDLEAEIAPLRAHFPEGLGAAWVDPPATVAPGEAVTVTFRARNEGAGHRLPTGDPERFILLRAQAIGPDGAVLAEQAVRFGQVFQWSPTVKKLDDTRLHPREARDYSLRFTAPAAGAVRLALSASKWRISLENLKYHQLEGRYVAGRDFLDVRHTVTVR